MSQFQARVAIADQIADFIPDLTRYARSLARNMADADDLLQECLARALAKSHLFHAGTNLKAWLFTIMRNLHTSELRRRSRSEVPADLEPLAGRLPTAPEQEDRIMLRTVDAAFQSLPETQRTPLELVALDGLSYEEASALLNVPVGTLKSRVSRGRAALRELISEPGANDIAPHQVAA